MKKYQLKGFDFRYEISPQGELRSFAKDRKLGKILTGSKSASKEMSYTLVENGKAVRMTINQLLFMAKKDISYRQFKRMKKRFFVRKDPNKPYHISNIEVVNSRSETWKYIWQKSTKMKTRSNRREYKRQYSDFFAKKLIKAVKRNNFHGGLTMVAKQYGVNRSTLQSIYSGKIYANLQNI